MLIFLLGLMIAVIGVILCLLDIISLPITCMLAFIGLLMLYLSSYLQNDEYKEPIMMEEYQIVPIVEKTNIYAIETHNGEAMMYKYIDVKDNNEEKIYYFDHETYTIDVVDGEKAYLRWYVQKPKITMWHFPSIGSKSKFVLSIPKGGKVI